LDGCLAEPAPAKLNLYLHVVGRRDDGYHLLDSLVVFAGAADQVRVAAAPTLDLSVDGRFAADLAAEADNLVLRAARLLAAAAGVPARGRLHLTKALPVASGIGGGSADAAATLRLLARHWGLGSVPVALAMRLGADVPVCLGGRPARMSGIGEVLAPAPALPEAGIVLVNPGVPQATAAVFRARKAGFSRPAHLPAGWADACAMAADLAGLANDLEAPALALCPAIAEVLAVLRRQRGCLLARMSGSGATCFGLFADGAAAARAAADLTMPGWWVWGGPMLR
jgi:4-diphosphocytidyl-2-C-methyl-D-erythritol kinase